jgi:hypothetical protein
VSEGDLLVNILLVDDDPNRLRGLRTALQGLASVALRTPEDVQSDDLETVDLISVDEFLGAEWSGVIDTTPSLSLRNEDGLAVAAAFRSQARASKLNYAVSLHTGALEQLARGLPRRMQEPLTAYQHDLDWVFDFASENLSGRLVQLAQAVRSATVHAGSLPRDFGSSWLQVPNSHWHDTAREQIEDCRPPAHALAENTHGRSYLRWLAQRILPFPTFLLSREYCANLLGITVESFDRLLGHPLVIQQEPQYRGPLDAFLGPRYWRAAIQQLLVDCGVEQWDSPKSKVPALSDFYGATLEALTSEQPVVAYDLDAEVASIDLDASDAVRVQVDGWPLYADDAWAAIDDVKGDEYLSKLVAFSDRARIVEDR